MLFDIFSNFDDQNKLLMSGPYFVYSMWMIPLIMTTMLMKYKPMFSNQSSPTLLMFKTVNQLVSRTQAKNIGGSMSVFSTLFLTLITLNLLGMVPYVFSITSHLAINLAISLPIWILTILLGSFFNFKMFLAHFQPLGSPMLLNPIMCIIELMSNIMRPVTLSVRMSTNLSTGHILLSLMGLSFTNSMSMMMAIILMCGIFYIMFEMAICVIQAYVFTLLPTLYVDEHPSN